MEEISQSLRRQSSEADTIRLSAKNSTFLTASKCERRVSLSFIAFLGWLLIIVSVLFSSSIVGSSLTTLFHEFYMILAIFAFIEELTDDVSDIS